ARVIDDLTEPWGVKVTLVEIKDVDLPDTMQRAMASQAEGERDRRARMISAEGEFQASQKLSDAAEVMARNPQAMQLRFLQTVTAVAAERNSTLVMPIPVELLTFFQGFQTGIDRRIGGAPPERPERPAPVPPPGEPVGARTRPMPIGRPGPQQPDPRRGTSAA